MSCVGLSIASKTSYSNFIRIILIPGFPILTVYSFTVRKTVGEVKVKNIQKNSKLGEKSTELLMLTKVCPKERLW